jgi:O-acetyl-ADP-ribose deacetylase (regulator of RNase III)
MTQAVSDGIRINRTTIRLIKYDITDLDIEAFVFYAQPDLTLGSGFGGAIAVRGGPTIQKELEQLAPVATGEAVVSAAGNLKAQHIIHAVGPRFQEQDTETKLYTTVLNCLKRAEEKGIEQIAFPAMGAGYYGILPEVSARVMMDVFKNRLAGECSIKEIVICVLDTPQYNSFKAALAALD